MTVGVKQQEDDKNMEEEEPPARSMRNKKVKWQLKWKERRLKRREMGKQEQWKEKGKGATKTHTKIKNRGPKITARIQKSSRKHGSGADQTCVVRCTQAVGSKRSRRDEDHSFWPDKKKRSVKVL